MLNADLSDFRDLGAKEGRRQTMTTRFQICAIDRAAKAVPAANLILALLLLTRP